MKSVTCVRSGVYFQVFGSAEALVALVTMVRLLVRVRSYVHQHFVSEMEGRGLKLPTTRNRETFVVESASGVSQPGRGTYMRRGTWIV